MRRRSSAPSISLKASPIEPSALDPSVEPLLEAFSEFRHAEVAETRAPIPSIQAAADNVLGYAYFLDADIVATTQLSPEHWTSSAIAGHRFAVVIAVGHPRPSRGVEPGAEWIEGAGPIAARLRGSEIATVVARYLGAIGVSASAHWRGASDIDIEQVALEAGVVEGRSEPAHPFLPDGLQLSVVTADLDLPVDLPLAENPLRGLWPKFKFGVGAAGTRPGWSLLSGRHRDWHLGRFPMEKLKRRQSPTTLIIPDEVKRVAERENFFMRAGAGDLGAKAQREFTRFIAKAPHGSASFALLGRFAALARGESAKTQSSDARDPSANAQRVKATVNFLGADMTAITPIPDYAWYSHKIGGAPVETRLPNAIVFVLDQGRETMEGASGDDWISGAQSMRAYLRAALIGNAIASHIRSLGFQANAYSTISDELQHIPLLLNAGIGELSRIGEVVLNPFVGPRFKSGVVATDLPLDPDQPIDFGLQDFCSKCTKCARECPVGAIRFGDKTMYNGYEMWKPDVHRCASYRVTNPRGSACGRCMKTCPYNLEGTLLERPFAWAARRLPFARAGLARLDDWVGNGRINPTKRWWLDIELTDGVPQAPRSGANQRDLSLGRERRRQEHALFLPMVGPAPDEQGPVPVDRGEALRAARGAETPAQARARVSRT